MFSGSFLSFSLSLHCSYCLVLRFFSRLFCFLCAFFETFLSVSFSSSFHCSIFCSTFSLQLWFLFKACFYFWKIDRHVADMFESLRLPSVLSNWWPRFPDKHTFLHTQWNRTERTWNTNRTRAGLQLVSCYGRLRETLWLDHGGASARGRGLFWPKWV